MTIQDQILVKLNSHKIDFVNFVDISKLTKEQNKSFPNAILIGMVLPPSFVQKVLKTPNYVQELIRSNGSKNDKFHIKELQTDGVADIISDFLIDEGYKAYSQSELRNE